jgi:chromosome segregation ATPase
MPELSKVEVETRLVSIASEVKTKLHETGERVFKVGLLLIEAKRLCGSVKVFEAWLSAAVGMSVATAYRWIAQATSLSALQLDRYPDLLEAADVADMLQVTVSATQRRRLESRAKVYQAAARDAAEATKTLEKEKGKLSKLEAEAKDAAETLEKAKERAVKHLAPVKSEADGKASLLSDARERVKAASEKVQNIISEARGKVADAKAKVTSQGQKVAEAASRQAAAEAAKTDAKAGVKAEAEAAKQGKAAGKADAKAMEAARDWEAFHKATVQTVCNRALSTFPDAHKAAEAVKQIANGLLGAAQNMEKGQALKAA